MTNRGILLFLISVSFLLSSCKREEKLNDIFKTKGQRMMGIHCTEAEGIEFEDAFLIAKEAGMNCVPQTVYWNMLENENGYDPLLLLEILNIFYPAHQMAVSLCITPIQTIFRGVPPDLMEVPFSDPTMINRFKRLLDTVHAKAPDLDLRFLIIGNEVDLYFDAHPEQWDEYCSFIEAVVPYAKSVWGDKLLVSAETTLTGAMGENKDKISRMNRFTDMVCFSYYPIGAGFVMNPVDHVKPVIDAMMAQYPGRRMFMEECGYATSAACNSSDQKQADFISETFDIWDNYSERLIYIGFLWLHDLKESDAQYYVEQYGMSGQEGEFAFKEYLRTCGMRNYSGYDKAGFTSLKSEAKKRGW